MIAVEYHADLKEVQFNARLSALLSPDEQHAPFDRLDWLQGLVSDCDMEPMVATAQSGSSIAVLPLRKSGDQLSGLTNYYTFRFRPLVSENSNAPQLMEAIAMDLLGKVHRVTLSGVPDEDGSATLLETSFRKAGWLVVRETSDSNHVLNVNGRTWQEYFAERPGALRSTIKRKSRNLKTCIFDRFDDETWRDYEAIYAESWKPEEGSMGFLRSFARQEGAAGRLRLGFAFSGGTAVAAQLWTVENHTAYIHKLAYRSSARALSPGSVLSAAMFRHVIDKEKVALVDYGTGDDSYKRDWMEEVRPRYSLDFYRASSPKNWLPLAKTGLRRLAPGDKPV